MQVHREADHLECRFGGGCGDCCYLRHCFNEAVRMAGGSSNWWETPWELRFIASQVNREADHLECRFGGGCGDCCYLRHCFNLY